MANLDHVVAKLDARRETPAFAPQALDYRSLLADGIPEPDFIVPPYIFVGSSVLAVGPTESAKTMYMQATCSDLSRRGVRCVYISQENPLAVDLRRLGMLRPDPEFLTVYHDQGFDLARPEHVGTLIERSQGTKLIVLDTLTACWSGDENDNAAVVGFDRDVVRPIIRETGAAVTVIDHTGHAQAFVTRKGASAPRGASAKGQKADTVLEFKSVGPQSFVIEHGKNRLGGRKAAPRQYKIVDIDDERIELVAEENTADLKVRHIADQIAGFVTGANRPVATREVREAVKGHGGREAIDEALELLRFEDPPRLETGSRKVLARDGKERRAAAWWPAGAMFDG